MSRIIMEIRYPKYIEEEIEDVNELISLNEELISNQSDDSLKNNLSFLKNFRKDLTQELNESYESYRLVSFDTIIEKEGKIPFDLDHNRIFMYSHLGKDIGADEVLRCQKELEDLIKKIANKTEVDSPFYSFMKVEPPKISNEEFQKIIKEMADKEKHIFAIVENAKKLMSNDDFNEACKYWEKARKIVSTEPYFTQQHALCKYKSELPSKNVALTDGLKIIEELEPDKSNDPETLGITGAINKNIFFENDDIEYLNRAIMYYGKGFKVRNDYYTGENYALCLNIKAKLETDKDERTYLIIEAKKTRQKIIDTLTEIIISEEFEKYDNKKWIYATLANCYLGLKKLDKFEVNQKNSQQGVFY